MSEVGLTKEDLEALKAGFAPHEVFPKIIAKITDSQGNMWVTLQAYVPSYLIEERLDRVDPSWKLEIQTIEKSTALVSGGRGKKDEETEESSGFFVVVLLTVKGVTRYGIGFDPDPRIAATMAFKNAASRFGIGRYLDSPMWMKRKRVPDDKTYRRLVYDRELCWEEAMALLEEKTPAPAPSPSPQKPAQRLAQPKGKKTEEAEEEIPF